jgi:hypothetical protein
MSALLGLAKRNGSREMLYAYWGIVGSFQLEPPSWTDLLPEVPSTKAVSALRLIEG